MNGPVASANSVEIDPKPTLGHRFRLESFSQTLVSNADHRQRRAAIARTPANM